MYEHLSDDDLNQLFNGCLLRYKGVPVYVRTLGDGKVQIDSIGGSEFQAHVVNISDKNFDYSPVPLGYCNVEGYAYYAARRHRRQFVVGLTRGNMVVTHIGDNHNDKAYAALINMKTKGLRDCIMGKYPSVAEAIEELDSKKATTVGIDRSFAVDRDHCLYFKDKRIGVIEKDNKPYFFHTKSYMKVLWEQGYAGTKI